jgi:hypothetical protein
LGFGALWQYQTTPGEAASASSSWPTGSSLPVPHGHPVVLQFVHPHCPCSRASLIELAEAVERLPTPPATYIVFMLPEGVAEGWERTDTWKRAQEIPGASVLVDRGGTESRRFGVKTSGQTFVYGAGGELLFTGGLTPARGEVGDSAGAASVGTVLAGLTPARRESVVFGCPLEATNGGGE